MRVEYIPDNRDDIKETALKLRARVGLSGFVFSSGGIGPTHDDVTYESLASAFGACAQDSLRPGLFAYAHALQQLIVVTDKTCMPSVLD